MSSYPTRLYTWVDVESVVRGSLEVRGWPEWLSEVSAYWDGLVLKVREHRHDELLAWLESSLGPRLSKDSDSAWIELEAVDGKRRKLPVEIEVLDQPLARQVGSRLTFEAPSRMVNPHAITKVSDSEPGDPPVVAFHSFKGGVGRTTSALSLAVQMSKRNGEGKILLVDADLEAPGITFMLDERLPDPPVSFADLLALVHGDLTGGAEAIELVATRLQDSCFDGLMVLPAFRSISGYQDLAIRPEHILRASENPFRIVDILRALARRCGCSIVITDLRAGVSEIAAGVLLDPSVRRVLVTSLGGQSLKGTEAVLRKLVRSDRTVAQSGAAQRGLSGELNIIFSQSREEDGEAIREAQERFSEIAIEFSVIAEDQSVTDGSATSVEYVVEGPLRFLNVPFDAGLVSLSRSWSNAIARINASPLPAVLDSLVLVSRRVEGAGETSIAEADHYREELGRLATRLEHAETGEGEDFLATAPIVNIASDHRSAPPAIAVVGAKGAGKSFMYLQLVRSHSWREFVRACGVDGVSYDSSIWPILQPLNLGPHALEMIEDAKRRAVSILGTTPRKHADVVDLVRAGLVQCKDESDWRQYWLDIFGFAAGLEFDHGFERLLALLVEKNARVTITIDGLEDVFQSLWEDESQKTALRSLLQDVLGWIAQLPGRPLGIVVFVRRDMVTTAIKQNSAQFLSRYRPYELKWSPAEALRLALWVWEKVSSDTPSPESKLSDEDVIQRLTALWGVKLGSAASREAYAHEWALSVLSDFQGQVQARDVMRLLRVAAGLSAGDTKWTDRVLSPSALRKAPALCGEEKVNEISQESPRLKEIFEKLRKSSAQLRTVPFSPKDLQLSSDEIEVLERSGVVLREEDGYYMPEMIRHGLQFTVPRGARPRVLALARRARSGKR